MATSRERQTDRIAKHMTSDETCFRYIGVLEDQTEEELWDVGPPLTDKEVEIAMSINKLKILYLLDEQQSILWSAEKYKEANDETTRTFVEELARLIEIYGEDFVSDNLEPLGYRPKDYFYGLERIKKDYFRK